MPELQYQAYLASAQVNTFTQVLFNRQQSLVMAFSLRGPDAQFLGKDWLLQINSWQIESAQQLHAQLLDLIKNCRLQKLDIQLALAWKNQEQLVLATNQGQIYLQRQGQLKKILESKKPLEMLIGQLHDDDQLLLLAGDGQQLEKNIAHLNLTVGKTLTLPQTLLDQGLIAVAHCYYQAAAKHQLGSTIKQTLRLILRISQKLVVKIKNALQRLKKLSTAQQKRYLRHALIILASLIVLSTAALLYRQHRQGLLASAQQEIEQLINNDQLDKLINSQPLLAKERLENQQQQLENMLTSNNSKAVQNLIQDYIASRQQLIEQLTGQNNLEQLTVFADWRQSYPDLLGQKVIASDQGLVVSDQQQQILVIKPRSDDSYQQTTVQNLAVDYSAKTLALFIKAEGLYRLDWSDRSPTLLKVEGDSDRQANLMTNYQNYLYLVNPEKRNIYRYSYQNGELSEAIGWLVDKQELDFTDVVDISVDGDLWLSLADGQILRFNRGYRQDFTLSGLEQMPDGQLLISTREDIDKLVLLDSNQHRLLVVNKTGQVIKEIVSQELAAVSDIDLAMDGNSVFAVSGSLVYQITL